MGHYNLKVDCMQELELREPLSDAGKWIPACGEKNARRLLL